MAYAVRADIDAQYGSDNVDKWADLNNNQDEDEIEDRVDWALEAAEADVNDLLREGPWSIPFDDPCPNIIKRLTALQAGVLLYESRGVVDFDAEGGAQDQLSWQRKKFSKDIKDLLTNRRRIDVERVSATYPQVITEEDCS